MAAWGGFVGVGNSLGLSGPERHELYRVRKVCSHLQVYCWEIKSPNVDDSAHPGDRGPRESEWWDDRVYMDGEL